MITVDFRLHSSLHCELHSSNCLSMYNFSNRTKFGIQNDTERYPWASWLIFVVVSSLLGDSLILIASIKYKAFNIHKMIVAFIQHIAVCDLLNTLGSIAPATMSTIYNTGSPSRFINYLRSFISYYTSASSSVFISALVLGKLLMLKYPLKLRPLSKKRVHKLSAMIWAVCIFFPVLQLAIDKDDVVFDYRVYFSTYQYTSSLWKIFMPVSALIFLIAPVVTVVVSTVLILRKAWKAVRRNKKSLRWQGVTTVVLTGTSHVTAFLPIAIYFFAEPFVEKDSGIPGIFHTEFYRVASGIIQFQVISNFFIYSLTVASFRRFLVTKFRQIFCVCLKKSPSQGS